MRIATFNLENLDDRPDAEPPLAQRIAVLRPQLERLSAHVLCLQEVNGQKPPGNGPRQLLALTRLLEGTPYADYACVSSPGHDGLGVADRHNLVILSRFPVREWAVLRHDLVTPPAYRAATADPPPSEAEPVTWDRPVLHAVLELPGGRPLHVLDLHLRAPLAAPVAGQKESASIWRSVGGWAEGFFLATLKRAGQALEARLAVERIFDAEPEALVAVCGDCNAEEREMPLRILCADASDTGNNRLSPRSLVSLEHELPEERRFSVVHAGRKAMLDHLLVSRGLLARVSGIEAHNEGLGDELVAAASHHRSPESYHAPLVAEFDLPRP